MMKFWWEKVFLGFLSQRIWILLLMYLQVWKPFINDSLALISQCTAMEAKVKHGRLIEVEKFASFQNMTDSNDTCAAFLSRSILIVSH